MVFLASPRGSRWIIGLFAVAMLVGTLGRDVRRPLWHDEIFTQYVASASATAGLWNVLSTGVDLNPPLYYLCVRIAAAIVGEGAVATRLPSTLGFLVACLALYVFMRRRVHPWFAIVAALALPMTSAVIYAYEGRPYGPAAGTVGGRACRLAVAERAPGFSTPHSVRTRTCGCRLHTLLRGSDGLAAGRGRGDTSFHSTTH